ncbi:MAG: LamG domain-containing protein [Candidatus Thermoplasmatota archaeon]|nr:LamG domain-containing protein [Candidatus Thermoplasmatota archaeon]
MKRRGYFRAFASLLLASFFVFSSLPAIVTQSTSPVGGFMDEYEAAGLKTWSVYSDQDFYNGTMEDLEVFGTGHQAGLKLAYDMPTRSGDVEEPTAPETRGETRGDNPIGLWHLDDWEGSTAFDSSGNGNHGNLLPSYPTNSPAWVAGKIDGGLSFDGVDDYVEVPYSPIFNVQNEISIEAWVSFSRTGFSEMLVYRQSAFRILKVSGPDRLRIDFFIGGGAKTFNSNTITIGSWHYVAVTYDGSMMSAYIDGSLAGSAVQTGILDTNTNPIRFGKELTANLLNGTLDEVAIWDRALSPEEVNQRYLDAITPKITDVTCTPKVAGPQDIVEIRCTATDDVGISSAIISVTDPDMKTNLHAMNYDSENDQYVSWFGFTGVGTYTYNITAYDGDGRSATTSNKTFRIMDTLPPTSGDWVVDFDETYYNQTLYVDGNMVVKSGSNIEMDGDVTLQCQSLRVKSGATVWINNSIVYTGTIVVEDGGALHFDPSTIYLEGDLYVDGEFTLDGDTLQVNNTFNGQYNIYLNSTGKFSATGGSTIRSMLPGSRYMFYARVDSELILRNSEFRDCGWDNLNRGLDISTNNSIIKSMLFKNCFYALVFKETSGVGIVDSVIDSSNNMSVYVHPDSSAYAVNTTFDEAKVTCVGPETFFFKGWYLRVNVENQHLKPIAGAEVNVYETGTGGGNINETRYTNTAGRIIQTAWEKVLVPLGSTNFNPYEITVRAGGDENVNNVNVDSVSQINGYVDVYVSLNVPVLKTSGQYLSQVFSPGFATYWSYIGWEAEMPANTALDVWVRTGDSRNPEDGSWSEWAQAKTRGGSAINCTQWTTRIQFRVGFSSTDTNNTPVLIGVWLWYSDQYHLSITGEEDFAYGSTTYNITINEAGAIHLGDDGISYYLNGTYISRIFDTGGIIGDWRELNWYGEMPPGTYVQLYTRTGATEPEVLGATWDAVNSPIVSSPKRFIQVRAELSGDGGATPVIGGMHILGNPIFASDTSTEIRTDVGFPYIHEMYMRKASDDSDVFNKQVDAGAQYYFYIRANYSQGWSDNIELNITAWHDGGDESSTYDNAVADRSKANTQFHMRYASGPMGAEGIWQMLYPVTEEVHITAYQEDRVFIPGLSAEEDHRWLRVDFYLGPQVRNASSGGVWSVSADNDDSLQSFNDLHSWNVEAKISDNAYATASSSWYDEFGVYRYLSISSSGTPAGGGAPGASGVSLQPGTNISHSSNTAFYVNVSLTDLWDTGFANKIGARNISVWNMNATSAFNSTITTPTNFLGHEIPLYVWYNQTQTYMAPADYGNSTVGDTGTADGTTWLAWYIDIPSATPEGTYTGTIRYVIYFG